MPGASPFSFTFAVPGPPPPLPATSGSSGSSLLGLLEDLRQSRNSLEADRKAYEQSRHEGSILAQKLKQLAVHKTASEKKIVEVEKEVALKGAEFSHVTVKLRCIAEGLDEVEMELDNRWDELRNIQKKLSMVSNRYLNDSMNFAMMYNCTEIGVQNRAKACAKELEAMRIKKHQLECELETFLSQLSEVEKSERENTELELQFRAQEESEKQREVETQNQLSEMERAYEQLEKEGVLVDNKLKSEINRMQAKLKIVQQSISYWERRVSENQRVVSHQTNGMNMNTSSTTNSSTSPGMPLINTNAIRLANGQIITTNNKVPRLSQCVRPTPKVSNTNQPLVSEKTPIPQRSVQTRIQFSDPTKPQLVKPMQAVKFTPPISSTAFKPPAQAKPSNVTLSQSQFIPTPYSHSNPPSRGNTPAYEPLKKVAPRGRTFQFKKKSLEGPEIPGPTNRSVSVTIGSTPYASFQNSRTVLQSIQNQNKTQTQQQEPDEVFGSTQEFESLMDV